ERYKVIPRVRNQLLPFLYLHLTSFPIQTQTLLLMTRLRFDTDCHESIQRVSNQTLQFKKLNNNLSMLQHDPVFTRLQKFITIIRFPKEDHFILVSVRITVIFQVLIYFPIDNWTEINLFNLLFTRLNLFPEFFFKLFI